MLFAHDTEVALRGAAALVNTAATLPTDTDDLATVAELDAFVQRLGVDRFTRRTTTPSSTASAPCARACASSGPPRPTRRSSWSTTLLAEAKALPQLVRHGEWSWHLHATPPDAPLATRMAVEAAMAMVDVIRAGRARPAAGLRSRRLRGRGRRPVQEPVEAVLRRRLRQPRQRRGLPSPQDRRGQRARLTQRIPPPGRTARADVGHCGDPLRGCLFLGSLPWVPSAAWRHHASHIDRPRGGISTGAGRRADDGTPGLSGRAVRGHLHDPARRQRGQLQPSTPPRTTSTSTAGPGQGAPQTAAGLDDGTYVFQITDPSGKVLLSTDPAGAGSSPWPAASSPASSPSRTDAST